MAYRQKSKGLQISGALVEITEFSNVQW